MRKLAQALKVAAPGWSEEACDHIATEIWIGVYDGSDVSEAVFNSIVTDVEIANARALEISNEEADVLGAGELLGEIPYRAEEEPASRRPGAARLSSTLRSEIGYEEPVVETEDRAPPSMIEPDPPWERR